MKAPPPAPFEALGCPPSAQRNHERLHLPRPSTQSQSQAVGRGLFRAPLLNVTKDLQLYVGVSSESISFANPRRGRNRCLRRYSPDPSAHLPSISVSGATCIRAAPANSAPPLISPVRRLAQECANQFPAQLQYHEEGTVSFFRGLRKGHLTPSMTIGSFGGDRVLQRRVS